MTPHLQVRRMKHCLDPFCPNFLSVCGIGELKCSIIFLPIVVFWSLFCFLAWLHLFSFRLIYSFLHLLHTVTFTRTTSQGLLVDKVNFPAFFINAGRLYILPFETSSICTIALYIVFGFFFYPRVFVWLVVILRKQETRKKERQSVC